MIPTWLVEAKPLPLGGSDEDGAACRIAVKARLEPAGATTTDGVVIEQSDASVKVRGGSCSPLGTRAEHMRRIYFLADGTVYERVPPYAYKRLGTGQWSHDMALNLGCKFNRRYRFALKRYQNLRVNPNPDAWRFEANGVEISNSNLEGEVKYVEFPSPYTWTRYTTIQRGNLANSFF